MVRSSFLPTWARLPSCSGVFFTTVRYVLLLGLFMALVQEVEWRGGGFKPQGLVNTLGQTGAQLFAALD